MPLGCMNRAVGLKIGASMGCVEDVTVADDDVGWGQCLRIRMAIDLYQPLDRGRALILSGKSCWVSFRYEKLLVFCFRWGIILHQLEGCTVKITKKQSHMEGMPTWGSWLRAREHSRSGGRWSFFMQIGRRPQAMSMSEQMLQHRQPLVQKKERGLDRDYMYKENQSHSDFVEANSKRYSKSDKNLGGRKASCDEEVAKGTTTGVKGSNKGKSMGVSEGFEDSKEGIGFSKFGALKNSGPTKPHTAGSHMGLAYKPKGQFHVSMEEARAASHPPSPKKKKKKKTPKLVIGSLKESCASRISLELSTKTKNIPTLAQSSMHKKLLEEYSLEKSVSPTNFPHPVSPMERSSSGGNLKLWKRMASGTGSGQSVEQSTCISPERKGHEQSPRKIPKKRGFAEICTEEDVSYQSKKEKRYALKNQDHTKLLAEAVDQAC
jgi:hypothetical protein